MKLGNAKAFMTLAAVVVCAAGCVGTPMQKLQLPRYTPDTNRYGDWFDALRPSRPEALVEDTVTVEPTNVAGVIPRAPVVDADPIPVAKAEVAATRRAIKKGDRLNISLLGIPDAQKIEDVVDDEGGVRLPHINTVKIAGLTTSEAEARVEKTYVDGDIYPSINVVIVSLDDEFFIQGEVKRPGRYPLTGGMTLMKAIATASAYTEFAKKSEVQIIRGQKVMIFNMKRIQKGKDEDPLIERGDSIIVPRGWL